MSGCKALARPARPATPANARPGCRRDSLTAGPASALDLRWLLRQRTFFPGRCGPCSTLDDMLDEEIRRYAKVLEAVVKLSDFSTRELERRLGLGGGTLNRIFAGKIDLKLRHILLVLEVVGMKPERFFQIACVRP